MGEVINFFDRKKDKAEVVSTYGVKVELDEQGDVVSGYVQDWGALNHTELRRVATHLEQLAFWMRLDAEQECLVEDADMIATVKIFRSSRVRLWTHGDLETEEQAEWLKETIDAAKGLVEVPARSNEKVT